MTILCGCYILLYPTTTVESYLRERYQEHLPQKNNYPAPFLPGTLYPDIASTVCSRVLNWELVTMWRIGEKLREATLVAP